MTTLIETDVIAGPFTASFTPVGGSLGALGVIGGEGFRWTKEYQGEPIVGDRYGKNTILDGVYTGGNLYLEFVLQEMNKSAVKQLAYPFNETTTSSVKMGLENELGIPGVLWSSSAGSLILTAVTGTKAASETTPTRTFGNIVPAMGHTLQMALRAGLKSFPMRVLCLPYDIGSGKIGTHTRS